jgi:hypothetical protein
MIMNWRGTWSTASTYAVGDCVSYIASGSHALYICLVANVGAVPASNPAKWGTMLTGINSSAVKLTDTVNGTVYTLSVSNGTLTLT